MPTEVACEFYLTPTIDCLYCNSLEFEQTAHIIEHVEDLSVYQQVLHYCAKGQLAFSEKSCVSDKWYELFYHNISQKMTLDKNECKCYKL